MPIASEPGTSEPPAARESPPAIEPLTWSAHPARERPLTAVAAVAVIIAFATVVYGVARDPLWAVGATIVMCLVQSRFFFSTRYAITPNELTISTLLTTRRLAWREVRRIDIGSHAAWATPYRRRTWREYRRGIHVLYGSDPPAVRARLETATARCRLEHA